MFLQPGDIIIIKHMIYKDNNKIDIDLSGHPALLLCTSLDFLYYLSLSTSPSETQNPHQHYFLSSKKAYLKKNSFVNLKNIYKIPLVGYKVRCYIPDEIFYDILKCFQYYQENIKTDSLYPEIKDETDAMVRKLKKS